VSWMDNRPQLSGVLQPHRLHGLVFDGLAIAGSVALVAAFPRNGEALPDRTTGFLLLAAILTQILGALAKTGPLQQRLGGRAAAENPGCSDRFMQLLLFWHFILFTITVAMAFGLLGVVDLNSAGSETGLEVWPAIAMLIAGITTFTVWRAGKRSSHEEQEQSPRSGFEYGADVLLSLSVSIITFFYWDVLVVGSVDSAIGIGFGVRGMVLVFSLAFLFTVFYLPSRYLFLIEDARYAGTWARVWLVMLALAWRVLVG
jgi:hypothetical protein